MVLLLLLLLLLLLPESWWLRRCRECCSPRPHRVSSGSVGGGHRRVPEVLNTSRFLREGFFQREEQDGEKILPYSCCLTSFSLEFLCFLLEKNCCPSESKQLNDPNIR